MRRRGWGALAGLAAAALGAGCTAESTLSGLDLSHSQVLTDAANVALNGSDAGGVGVYLGAASRSGPGLSVSLAAPGCAVSPEEAVTDASGAAHFAVACAQPRYVEISASLTLSGVATPLPRTANLNFYAPSDGRRAVAPGAAVNLQLVARDAAGDPDPSYAGKVRFASSDPAAGLPADLEISADMAGVAQLVAAVTLHTLGEQTVTAVDANSHRQLASDSFLVSRGVGRARLLAPPPTAVAGQPLDLTVVGLHDDGSPDPAFSHQVLLSASDPAAVLSPPVTFDAALQGTASLAAAATFFTAGAQTLSITDQQTGIVDSVPLEVAAADASRLEVACAQQLTAGASCPVSVAARDAYGNLVPSYRGAVQLTCSDPLASAPSGVTFTAAAAGQAVAGTLTARTSGLTTVAARDGQRPLLTGSSNISVVPGGLSGLRLALPASAVAGHALTAVVSGTDGLGNVTPAVTGGLHFSASHARTLLPGDFPLGPADRGQRALLNALVPYDAGAEQFVVVDTGASGLRAQATVAVQPAAASQVALQLGGSVTAGAASDLTVSITDAFGNPCPSFVGTVLLTSSDGAASLPGGGSLALQAADAGVRRLPGSVVLRTAGLQTLRGQAGAGVAGTAAVQVAPGPASAVAVDGMPATTVVTQPLSPRLRVVDVFGNTVTTFVGSLSLSATPAGTTLPASVALGAADAGSLTLTHGLVPQATGPLTLAAHEPASGSAGSQSLTVTHGCWSYGDVTPLGQTPGNLHFRMGLAMDAAARPAITYDLGVPYGGATSTTQVQGWDGSSWQRFGSPLSLPFPDPSLMNSTLHFDSHANLIVGAGGYGDPVYFLRRIGSGWLPLGGAGADTAAPVNAGFFNEHRTWDFALDPNDTPWLVSEKGPTDGGYTDLDVFIFSGGSWRPPPAGSGLGLSGRNQWPSLAIDGQGVPTLAWASASSGNNEIYVARGASVAAGGSWRGLASSGPSDNISNNISNSQAPVLALDATGAPIVAWQDDASGTAQIYVRRFDGASWQEMGASASGGGISASASPVSFPEMAIDSQGYPVITWSDGNACMMRRWNGSAWAEQYGSATGSGVSLCDAHRVPVVLDPQDRAVMLFENYGVRVCSWR